MKWMLTILVLLFSGSTCLAQAPNPIPDDGPGNSVLVCLACNGIQEAIAANQANYAALEAQIDSLDAEIADTEALITEIQTHPSLPQEEKDILIASCRRDIIALQAQILLAEINLDAITETINGLWDSWFANGCDEADC